MKSEMYSWRVSPDVKTGMEREARRRRISLSAALDLAAREWLQRSGAESGSDDEQSRLHQAAAECFGAFAGADPHRSERVRQNVSERLRRRYDR